MMGSIGITVGIIGYFLFFSIELLSDLKYRTVRCILSAASEALMVWMSVVKVWHCLLSSAWHVQRSAAAVGISPFSRRCGIRLVESATIARRQFKVLHDAAAACTQKLWGTREHWAA